MRRLTLAAALGAAFATSAWGQLSVPVPLNTYTFTSGPGTGNNPVYVANRTFSAQNFSIANGGGSLSGPDACAGVHVHGSFFGLGDPGGNCGHGIIGLAQSAIPGASSLLQGSISSASSLLTGSIPGSSAGQFALTRPAFGSTLDSETGGANLAAVMEESIRQRAREDANKFDSGNFVDMLMARFVGAAPRLDGPDPRIAQDAAKPAAVPPANAPKDGQDMGPILSTLEEPTLAQMVNHGNPAPKPAADPPDPEREKFIEKSAQDIIDAVFSGDKDKGKAAASALGNAPRDLQNRVARKINERVQKIVNDALRTATNSAAGPPRSLN